MAKRDLSGSAGIGKYIGSALVLPIATFVGFGIGYGLDMLFHTSWLRFVFLVVGTVAGVIELVKDLSEGT